MPYEGLGPAAVDKIAGNTTEQTRTLVQQEVAHWKSGVATAKIMVE